MIRSTTLSAVGRLAAVGVAGALALTACASGSDSGASGGDRAAGMLDEESTGDPVDGGTLVFGSYSFPTSLDPTVTQTAGSTGGSELAAIYDTLVKVDADKAGFSPQLAEKLEHDDDYTEFTVTLREDTTFSDGTVLDAEAVKWSIDRFVAAGADSAQVFDNVVEEVEVRDERTVVFHLVDTWMDFPVLLAAGAGMIVGQGADGGEEFTPIGAGPFTVDSFRQNEELRLVANADYHGDGPYLDEVRFVPSAGARAQLDSLESGQLDLAYLFRDETVISDAQDIGYTGYLDQIGLGTVVAINNRDGYPGEDVRVRQAIAYGVDTEAINERVNEGEGIASTEILPDTSIYYSGAEGVEYDPDKARELLDEAKADGYDGKIEYLATTDPSAEAAALTTQAALEAIGFDVEIDFVSSVPDLVRRQYVEHDFDMARAAFSFTDEAPYLRLYSGIGSDSNDNSTGYSDAEMDELLLAVRSATDEDEKKDAIAAVQERFNETIPYALWGPASVFLAWNDEVHGVHRSFDNIVLLDQVWMD